MTAQPFGTEGPAPVQHRCRVCRQPVETYRPRRTRLLVAKRHWSVTADTCRGSYGPVDAAADMHGEAT